jgi:hypothetical protein
VAAPTLRSAVASAAAQRPARRSRLAISPARRHTRFSVARRLLAAHQLCLEDPRRLEQPERPERAASAVPWYQDPRFLGAGALTLGSILGDTQIANANSNLAHDYMALGAPSRQRYEDSFNPNFDVSKITGLQQAMDTSYQGLLHGLSTQGNPYGNPGGLNEAQKNITGNLILPTLQNYRNQNAASGGYGAFSTAAPQAASNAINASGNIYSDIGRGVGNALNPPPTLDQYFRQLSRSMTTLLEAYLDQTAKNQQQGFQNLQAVGTAQTLQQHFEDQASTNAMRTALSQSGGDPEKAMQAALRTGNVAAANKLAPLLKIEQDRKQREETPRLLAELDRQQQPKPDDDRGRVR